MAAKVANFFQMVFGSGQLKDKKNSYSLVLGPLPTPYNRALVYLSELLNAVSKVVTG